MPDTQQPTNTPDDNKDLTQATNSEGERPALPEDMPEDTSETNNNETDSGATDSDNADDAPAVKTSKKAAKKDKKDTDDPTKKGSARQEKTKRGVVVFNDTYEILSHKRIPHLDNGPIKAYEAHSLSSKNMFAMVCENHLPARFRDSQVYLKNTEGGLLKYAASGKIYWAPDKIYRHVIIYEGIPGKPIIEKSKGIALGLKPDHVMRSFLQPVIDGLKTLRDLDLYHGHLRLDNIYGVTKEGSFDKVILGDCLSLPSSYTDHLIYLPAHKAVAQPSGRGIGSISDDLYALGVCAAMMLRSADPTKNITEREMVKLKLSQGSYMTLTNKDRFSGGILELLRGLLQDDPSQRWTMDEVLAWMDGQRLVPKHGIKRSKAGRPIALGDQKYYYAETLAMDMHENLPMAAQMIENDSLEQWISRSVEDSRRSEKLEAAIRTSREYGRTSYYWDRLVSRTSMALDPKQPIRYRGYSMFPDGIGTVMAESFALRKDMNPFIQIINQQVVPYWIDLQSDTQLDLSSLGMTFESCRNSLKQNQIGYGLERCVYLLAQEVPCLSEQYNKFLIRSASDFIDALEELAANNKMPRDIFDPHITAFLLVRENRVIDPFLSDLNSNESFRRILGTMKVLAAIQRQSDSAEYPNITKWAAKYIISFFDRYHDSKIREGKIEEIKKNKNKGDIRLFVQIMDDARALQKDANDFRQSIREYYQLKLESYKYETALSKGEKYGIDTGREIGALVSGFVASIIILIITFIFFSGGNVIP